LSLLLALLDAALAPSSASCKSPGLLLLFNQLLVHSCIDSHSFSFLHTFDAAFSTPGCRAGQSRAEIDALQGKVMMGSCWLNQAEPK